MLFEDVTLLLFFHVFPHITPRPKLTWIMDPKSHGLQLEFPFRTVYFQVPAVRERVWIMVFFLNGKHNTIKSYRFSPSGRKQVLQESRLFKGPRKLRKTTLNCVPAGGQYLRNAQGFGNWTSKKSRNVGHLWAVSTGQNGDKVVCFFLVWQTNKQRHAHEMQ